MAPALVDRLVKDPAGVRLGSERREITILFTDLRDFTTISEPMDAQELLRYTNRYLGPTTQAIVDRHGTSTSTSATPPWRSGTRRSTTTSTRATPASPCSASGARSRR